MKYPSGQRIQIAESEIQIICVGKGAKRPDTDDINLYQVNEPFDRKNWLFELKLGV